MNENVTPEALDRLEAMEKAATPRPWRVFDGTPCIGAEAGGVAHCGMVRQPQAMQAIHAALIVAARNALPDLIAEIRRLKKERDEAWAELERLRNVSTSATRP